MAAGDFVGYNQEPGTAPQPVVVKIGMWDARHADYHSAVHQHHEHYRHEQHHRRHHHHHHHRHHHQPPAIRQRQHTPSTATLAMAILTMARLARGQLEHKGHLFRICLGDVRAEAKVGKRTMGRSLARGVIIHFLKEHNKQPGSPPFAPTPSAGRLPSPCTPPP